MEHTYIVYKHFPCKPSSYLVLIFSSVIVLLKWDNFFSPDCLTILLPWQVLFANTYSIFLFFAVVTVPFCFEPIISSKKGSQLWNRRELCSAFLVWMATGATAAYTHFIVLQKKLVVPNQGPTTSFMIVTSKCNDPVICSIFQPVWGKSSSTVLRMTRRKTGKLLTRCLFFKSTLLPHRLKNVCFVAGDFASWSTSPTKPPALPRGG